MSAIPLNNLVEHLDVTRIEGDTGIAVSGVTQDSRRASSGTLFVAIRGGRADGNRFVDQAAERGAVAVISELNPPAGHRMLAWVTVPDARSALSKAARVYHGSPDEQMSLVGVTGTNGKTTTVYLIRSMFESAGIRCGQIGGVDVFTGDHHERATLTTPEADDFYALLARMHDNGCTHCVMEVSSHALSLGRVDGAVFRGAAFTNLSRDHLDFHTDMDGYFHTKKKLFGQVREDGGTMVVNIDDPYGTKLAAELNGRAITCGTTGEPDYRATRVAAEWSGTSVTMTGRKLLKPLIIHSPLIGRVNGSNLLLAATLALELGIDPEAVARGASSTRQIPGRFQVFSASPGFRIVVDYAHTDDALRNLLLSMRELTATGRLITVFGCGGDRDPGKRRLMGATAAEISDVVVITSDNPRSEDPMTIIGEIEGGCRSGLGETTSVTIVPDRREAITGALRQAQAEDTVVIAGKGHEDYQILGKRTIHFDDRELVQELVREMGIHAE